MLQCWPTLHSLQAIITACMLLPILNYEAAVWDPYHAKYVTQLERVQCLAAHSITGKWDRDADDLLQQL